MKLRSSWPIEFIMWVSWCGFCLCMAQCCKRLTKIGHPLYGSMPSCCECAREKGRGRENERASEREGGRERGRGRERACVRVSVHALTSEPSTWSFPLSLWIGWIFFFQLHSADNDVWTFILSLALSYFGGNDLQRSAQNNKPLSVLSSLVAQGKRVLNPVNLFPTSPRLLLLLWDSLPSSVRSFEQLRVGLRKESVTSPCLKD